MTRTEHYQLPQWAANDPVRREDFNEAFAALDGVYGPARKPYVCGSVTIPGDAANGTVLVEFDFEPGYALVCGGSMAIVPQGDSGRISDTYGYTEAFTHSISIRLSGNQLVLSLKQSQVTSSVSLNYIAVR